MAPLSSFEKALRSQGYARFFKLNPESIFCAKFQILSLPSGIKSHARRIYENTAQISYQAARKLAKKIREGEVGNPFSVREVYRKEWSLLKSKSSVESACHILISQGWLRDVKRTENGKTILEYQVNPLIFSSQ